MLVVIVLVVVEVVLVAFMEEGMGSAMLLEKEDLGVGCSRKGCGVSVAMCFFTLIVG